MEAAEQFPAPSAPAGLWPARMFWHRRQQHEQYTRHQTNYDQCQWPASRRQQTQNLFKGKIYFTIDHNLWVIDPSNNAREITHGGNLYDPAISPDGKWIACIARYKDYSNLIYLSTTGNSAHLLRSG